MNLSITITTKDLAPVLNQWRIISTDGSLGNIDEYFDDENPFADLD